MTMTVQKRFGDGIITKTADGDDETCIRELTFFMSIPTTCTNCNKTNTALNYRNVKDYDFYGVKCLACGAECHFGKLKAGGFFIKDNGKFSVWKGKEDTPETTANPFGD